MKSKRFTEEQIIGMTTHIPMTSTNAKHWKFSPTIRQILRVTWSEYEKLKVVFNYISSKNYCSVNLWGTSFVAKKLEIPIIKIQYFLTSFISQHYIRSSIADRLLSCIYFVQ